MKAAVVTFPGSNCDRDLALAFERAGFDVVRVWHKDSALPAGVDVVGVPGGFSFGDYLRCGAIAAQSPIAGAIQTHAARGGYVLGICNGFQVLTEMRLLPGVLMRNAGLKFACKTVELKVATTESAEPTHSALTAHGRACNGGRCVRRQGSQIHTLDASGTPNAKAAGSECMHILGVNACMPNVKVAGSAATAIACAALRTAPNTSRRQRLLRAKARARRSRRRRAS